MSFQLYMCSSWAQAGGHGAEVRRGGAEPRAVAGLDVAGDRVGHVRGPLGPAADVVGQHRETSVNGGGQQLGGVVTGAGVNNG